MQTNLITKKFGYMQRILNFQFWEGLLIVLGSAIGSFIAPSLPFITLASGLVVIDTITGRRAARKRGEKIVSAKFFRLVEKIGVYFLAILAGHGMDVVFLEKLKLFDNGFVIGSALAICLVEYKSISENVQVITGANLFKYVQNLFSRMQPTQRETDAQANSQQDKT